MEKIQDVREAAVLQSEDSLATFQMSLEDLSDLIQSSSSATDLIELLQAQEEKLVEQYLAEADVFTPSSDKEDEQKSLAGYIWNYFLPEKFKNLSLLVRDTVLQLCIAQQSLAEKKIKKAEIETHFEECKKLLAESIQTVCKDMAGEIQVLKSKDGALERKFESIQHLQNPWKIYREQFTMIVKQIQDILNANEFVKETIMTFTLIRSNLERMGFDIKKQNLVFLQKTRECQTLFKDLTQGKNIDQTLNWLEAVLDDLVKFEGKQEHQVRVLEGWLESLKTFTTPVGSQDGVLVTKQIDFKKTTTKWLDYFILPDIIELWEDQEAIISRIKHVISQVRGSLTVAQKAESPPSTFNSERNLIDQLLEGINENSRRANNLLIHIEETISSDFTVTSLYAEKEFLKVPLQTSFNGFRSKNNTIGQWFRKNLDLIRRSIDKTYQETRDKTPHEELEFALQVIENRTHSDHPDHYHALFLTKNFVGDLFLVPRSEEENRLEEIVAQWKSGKSRSVLIAGAPLCGKSTMAEHLSKVDFPKQTILLTPDTDLIVEGRKYRTTYNLKEALDFVRRALHNSSPLILIDDLQLWKSKETTLLANVKSLLDFISTHGSRALVLATLPDILVTHLDSRLPFSSSFTNYLNLNQSTTEQIYRAIMLRHGASHKVLYSPNDEPLSDREIQKKVQALSKKFENNLGAVLQAWTFCTEVFESERVQFVEKNIELNDFFDPVEILLLKHILLFGYGSELEFKTFFEDRFELEIRPAIRKLLNIHILGRNEVGQLIVEDYIKQDVYSLLNYKEVFG